MVDVAVQLYSLRALDASLPALLDRVGEAGYDGVEFAYRVREAPVDDVLAALDRNGLDAASAHVPIEALEDVPAEWLERDFEATLELYDGIGVDTLVVPWLDPEHFRSAAAVDAVAARLDDLAAAVGAEGVRFAYHNHDQEFASVGGAPAIERLLARTDDRLGFEVDVGWALAGGADPVELLRRYADRVSMVHMKDVYTDSEEVPELGEGDLDIDAVGEAAHDIGAEWLIYDNDEPRDPSTVHRLAADVLSRHA